MTDMHSNVGSMFRMQEHYSRIYIYNVALIFVLRHLIAWFTVV